MDDATLALFELLEEPARPTVLKEPRLGAINTKWTAYNGAHKPCDFCVQAIHEQGVNVAPPPRPARRKRVGPNDTLLLCDVDAMELRRLDDEATKIHKARVAEHGGVAKRTSSTKKKTREGMA